MTNTQHISKAKKATQFMFLICGLGLSSWAPMVPFAKDRLSIHEADLGLLLLALGFGALITMPLSGFLMQRFGSRKVIAAGTLIVALSLPSLLIISSFSGMLIALFLFGCGIGSVDVAMNAHGVQVQNIMARPIMSSLHGLFSVGGLLGSLGLGFLIKTGLSPIMAAIAISTLLIILLFTQYRNLFSADQERSYEAKEQSRLKKDKTIKNGAMQWCNIRIFILGFLCFSVFLSEGAMLDWSAILLRDVKNSSTAWSGLGYAFFSVAMAVMRLSGDRIVERLQAKTIVVGGSLIAVIGLAIVIYFSVIPMVLLGFTLLGIGSANIVPIFFSEGGRITGVSPNVSISAITTMGYAGQLVGPALLGFIAHHVSLEAAFGTIMILMASVAIIYGFRNTK